MPSVRIIKADEHLFLEGTASKSLFIIKRGALSIRKPKISAAPNETKSFIELSKITAGEILGELSFFDRKPRSAAAIAVIETEVIEITFEELEALYSNIPSYLKTIMESLANRLREASESIRILQHKIEAYEKNRTP